MDLRNSSTAPQFTSEPIPNTKHEQSRLLAKVFGYLAIGLAITAIVSFGLAYLFANLIFADPDTGFTAYLVLMICSGVALIIDTFVMHFMLRRAKHSLWAPYIIYTVLMGVFLSSFLLIGIDFATIGLAFGITALVFGIMFLIGYFSPVNLNLFATIALGMLSTFSMIFLVFWIMIMITGNTWAYYLWSIVYSLVIAVVVLLVTAVDAYNLKKMAKSGQIISNNVALYSAFSMYVDFINIFVRVLYVLILMSSKNKN